MTDPVIHGLSNEAYHHEAPYSEYLSSSQLKRYAVSPKAFKFALDNPVEEKSDALRFGSLFHDLMACMAEHNGEWDAVKYWRFHYAVFEPPLNPKGQPFGKTTKTYLEAYANFEKENADLIIATQEELNLAYDMCHSLWCKSGATSEQVRKALRYGSSGYGARIGSSGDDSVICCAGHGSMVKAKKGSWITLSEWVRSDEKGRWVPKCVKTEFVDGERIKADTWYRLVDGEFKECDD